MAAKVVQPVPFWLVRLPGPPFKLVLTGLAVVEAAEDKVVARCKSVP